MSELEQVNEFISLSKHSGLTQVLADYAKILANRENEPSAPETILLDAANRIDKSHPSPEYVPPLPSLSTGSLYIPIQSFAWDQGDYNSPTVTIYVELPGVGGVRDNVKCNFTASSFDLTV